MEFESLFQNDTKDRWDHATLVLVGCHLVVGKAQNK